MEGESRVFSAIRTRRSVREYDGRPVEEWKLDLILEAIRLAPSSTNSQPWRVAVVVDERHKKVLASSTPGGIRKHSWFKACPAILVLCAVPSKVQRTAQMIGKDYHLVDMGIAGEHAVLVATELGLGTCWVGWVDKKRIKEQLDLPRSWAVVCLLTLGYPAGEKDALAPVGELLSATSRVSPRQEPGEPGLGGIESRKRKPLERIVVWK